MNVVKLKNGAEEAEPAVKVGIFALKDLCSTSPLVFYDLVMLCRDPKYKAWCNMGPAKDAGLMQPDGNIHDTIKNIVLSAVTGEGLKMQIGSPI